MVLLIRVISGCTSCIDGCCPLSQDNDEEKQLDRRWFGGDDFERGVFGRGYSCLSESYADGELARGVLDVCGALGVNGVYTTDDNHAP